VRDQLSRLLHHTLVYGVASLAGRIASLVLLRILTTRLTTADYGAIEVLVALSALLVPVLRAGVATGFYRFWFDRDLAPDQAEVLCTSFTVTLAGAAVGLVVGVVAAPWIAVAVGIGQGRTNLVRVAFVMLAAQIIYEQLTGLYRVEEQSRAWAAASLANLVITITATIILVVPLALGATGALAGNAAGTIIVTVVLCYRRRAQLGLSFDRDLARRMNQFGLPLLPAGLLVWVVDFSDRLLLSRMTDASQVGLYAVGAKIASVMILVQLAFRTAWPAFAYSLDEQHARRAFAFVLTYIAMLGAWVTLMLGLLAPWLVRVLTGSPAFWGGERVVAPLAFAAALLTAYTMLTVAISRANRTERFWWVSGVGAAVNILVNVALIPRYGMTGAAVGTVVAYVVLVAGMLWLGQRVYPVAYQWRRITTALVVGGVVYATGRLTHAPLGVEVVLIAAYPLLLAACGFLVPAERRQLGVLWGRLRVGASRT
jgi:O-antigen/teichoic acid export membrane protein